jgi:hypothetical protein
MAETLGSLCDKLTIVKLKQWHTTAGARLQSLAGQHAQLVAEIDAFVREAVAGAIPPARITFASNKVLPDGSSTSLPGDPHPAISLGQLVSDLAGANCALWHEQEKVYEFEKVAGSAEKDAVVRRLAALNLERSTCIDAIDRSLLGLVTSRERRHEAVR